MPNALLMHNDLEHNLVTIIGLTDGIIRQKRDIYIYLFYAQYIYIYTDIHNTNNTMKIQKESMEIL